MRRQACRAAVATMLLSSLAAGGVHGRDIRARPETARAGDARPAPLVAAPLPPRRPAGLGSGLPATSPPSETASAAASTCLKQFEDLGGETLPAEPNPPSGDCAATEPVTFRRVKLSDGHVVALEAPVTLRCTMALELAHWIRDDLAPIAARQGAALSGLNGVGGQACRPRNRQPGGQLSEHASGNAFDLRALTLADRRVLRLDGTEAETKAVRDEIRAAACARFRTVLGPGADSFHADHLHVDMRQRNRDFKLCQWEVK
jgi:hypothetical protein